jgi:hypothetical protein
MGENGPAGGPRTSQGRHQGYFRSRSQRSRRPQPNKRREAHLVRSGGRRLRHRTSGASPRSQSSKQGFQHREAGREAQRPQRRTVWRFAQCSIRLCAKRQNPSSAPPFLLLCVENPACLPWIGSQDPLSACLDWPTQRCAHLARHSAGSDLGRSAGESVRYRHPGGNSSRVAVIRRISSTEQKEQVVS